MNHSNLLLKGDTFSSNGMMDGEFQLDGCQEMPVFWLFFLEKGGDLKVVANPLYWPEI